MGVNICHKDRKVGCKELKSRDVYLRLLVKPYSFWTDNNSTFNQVVLKRLFMICTNGPPLFLSQMIQKMKLAGRENKTAVLCGGAVTDDCGLWKCPS